MQIKYGAADNIGLPVLRTELGVPTKVGAVWSEVGGKEDGGWLMENLFKTGTLVLFKWKLYI